MAIDAAGNTILNQISSSYTVKDTEEEEDYLGRQDFLTMLVAQLENQDPLNPMEGSDFSAQLAQFSSLEQLINLNDSMESLAETMVNSTATDGTDYIGKQVTGDANSIEVSDGAVSTGYYNLDESADVMVVIYNSDGDAVKTLYPGQQDEGTHSVTWSGTDDNGDSVDDGTYTYYVLADSGSGYSYVSTTVTGIVEGVYYSNGKPYLEVDGSLLSVDSVTEVTNASTTSEETETSIVDYLGTDITTSSPLAYVYDGYISGNSVTFDLDNQEDVSITVYNSSGKAVNSMTLAADDTSTGTNTVYWDGTDDSGEAAENGLYTFSVSTSSSGTLDTSISDAVSGIKVYNGSQYLVLEDSGALAAISSVTEIN